MQREGRRTNRDGIAKTGYFWWTFHSNAGHENCRKILKQIDRFVVTALNQNSGFFIVLAWLVWRITATAFAMQSGMGTTIIRTGQISIRYCVQNSQ